MKTIVVISTRGFGVFRHDLLVDPDGVQFIGIFSEEDSRNVSAEERAYFHRIHVVPCGKPDASYTESSIVDEDAARAIVAELAEQVGPDDLTLHCYDERNLLLTGAMREQFGLRGPTGTDLLPYRDKCLMKEKLAGTGIRVPVFGRFSAADFTADRAGYFARIRDEVGLPFVLKPTDAASADGVHKVYSLADFEALPRDLGRPYEYEEHITGTMFSVNLVSKDQRTIFGGVTEYLVNSTQVQDECRVNADINLIDSDPRVPRMITFTEKVLSALGWLDGACHLELFHTADDELVFLEVGARFKGLAGLAGMQINYQVALLNLAFEVEAGLRSHPWDQEQIYCYDGVIPKRGGVVERLVEPDLESRVEFKWKVAVGDVIEQGASLIDNGGTFLVYNTDYDAAYRDFKRLADYTPIIYKER